MTDETVKDGTQDASVAPAPPTPVFTESSEAQRSVADPLAPVKTLLEQQRRDIQSMVDKALATQDKHTEQRLANLGVLGEYKQLLKDGYSDKEAEQELRLRQIEQGSPQPQAVPGRTALGGGQADSQFDVSAFAKEKGIDLNNADAIRIVQTPHSGPDALKADLLDWKLRQFTQTPDAAAAPSMQGGALPPPEAKTDSQILAGIRGSSDPFAPSELQRRAEKGDGGVPKY